MRTYWVYNHKVEQILRAITTGYKDLNVDVTKQSLHQLYASSQLSFIVVGRHTNGTDYHFTPDSYSALVRLGINPSVAMNAMCGATTEEGQYIGVYHHDTGELVMTYESLHALAYLLSDPSTYEALYTMYRKNGRPSLMR